MSLTTCPWITEEQLKGDVAACPIIPMITCGCAHSAPHRKRLSHSARCPFRDSVVTLSQSPRRALKGHSSRMERGCLCCETKQFCLIKASRELRSETLNTTKAQKDAFVLFFMKDFTRFLCSITHLVFFSPSITACEHSVLAACSG